MERGARLLAADLMRGGLEPLVEAPAVHSTTTSPLLRKIAWGALAAAGAAGAASVVAISRRVEVLNADRPGIPLQGYLDTLYADAEQLRVLGIAASVVTGLALVTWSVFLGLGLEQTPVTPVIGFGPGGASLSLALAF